MSASTVQDAVFCVRKSHASYMEGLRFRFITTKVLSAGQCGVCIRECYADAREMMGEKIQRGRASTEILKDRQYYGMSGGGVTFSGGRTAGITVKS